jgi:hypothetical protein
METSRTQGYALEQPRDMMVFVGHLADGFPYGIHKQVDL